MVVGAEDVILPGICIVLGNIVVLLCWQLLGPLRYTELYTDSIDQFGR